MNLIKTIFSISLFTILLCLICACKDDDLATDLDNLENFESFQEEAFSFSSDEINFNVVDCEMEDDNSIFMVGSSTQFGITSTILKVDSNFNIDFAKDISPNEQSIFKPMDLIKTNDENFLYCSRVFSDVDIRKFDPVGNLIWNTTIGNPDIEERGVSITEISDDNIMVLADDLESLFTDSCYSLITLNSNGSLISNFKITDTDINRMKRILYSPVDETVLVLGEYGFPGLGSFQTSTKVSKYSLSGELITSKIIVEEVDLLFEPSDMKLLSDGNILIYTSSNDRNNPNNPTPQIFKLDPDLNEIWFLSIDDIRVNIIDDIQETTGGDLLILSKSSTLNDDEFDVILTFLNKNLEVDWIKSYGSSSSDQGIRLMIGDNQDIIVVGNSNHDANSETNFNYFILKTDSEGVPK